MKLIKGFTRLQFIISVKIHIIPITCNKESKMKLIGQFIHNSSEAIKYLGIQLAKKVKHMGKMNERRVQVLILWK